MGKIVIAKYQGRSIRTQTRECNDIENFQPAELSHFMLNQKKEMTKQFGNIFITRPSPYYNCHGMVFANKRTCIENPEEITKILKDDKYEEIDVNYVLPGDIIIYYDSNGDLEHAGVVISEPDSTFKIPKVISKWGSCGEAIHYANRSPYNYANVKFYRIGK